MNAPFRENDLVEQVPAAPETAAENAETAASFEAPKPAAESLMEGVPVSTVPAAPVRAVPAPKDPITREVEAVLEEGLEEVYRSLPAAAKVRFRQEGEKVTSALAKMVRSLHVNVSKALSLIRGWLKTIPGINRYFLIQESKIKTDKILMLAEEEKKKRGLF